ncbi:CwfJ C-terminus 1-domain-containing protein-like protein [Roridomyces roridus]|uniref:CwfJ C-terminus 1-domain-containing protein-like protein n=1 Tax=Roridomyces roridus TaxID=1738132 RepID=A0AAD7FR66_9AGAR|nr:CwfJ C-terminus 1-domain-containing protein-like protein [Roridomyces roridus]
MQGDNPLSDSVIQKFAKTGGELCKNVFLLISFLILQGKSGIITTANGLRIACLGGRWDPEIYYSADAPPGFSSPFFSTHTMERLLANTMSTSTSKQSYKSLADIQSTSSSSQLIDVLLTHAWPAAITNLSSAVLPELASIGAPPLDDTIRRTKPRYHFAAGGGKPPMFWEREPFVWDDEQGRVSRFISLGAFGGEPASGKKQRWFYAFSIAPQSAADAPAPRPSNATKNPFTESSVSRPLKRPYESTAEGENYIFGNVRQPQKRTRVAEGDPGKPPPGYKCHRCESSEHFINDCPERIKPPEGKHLIVAIGTECYVTLPKGQIIPTQSAATDHVAVPGGGHVLIVPITHYPTFSTIPDDLAGPIIEETEKHKAALRAMYAKYHSAIVVFEVGKLGARGGHAHVQAVPVPMTLKDKVEDVFRAEGRMMGVDFEEDPEAALAACSGGRGSYFRVDLPDGRKLVHLMKDHVPFGIQFGRQVLVSLLKTPERLDWKACALGDDEDRADAEAFKAAFTPFNPTI